MEKIQRAMPGNEKTALAPVRNRWDKLIRAGKLNVYIQLVLSKKPAGSGSGFEVDIDRHNPPAPENGGGAASEIEMARFTPASPPHRIDHATLRHIEQKNAESSFGRIETREAAAQHFDHRLLQDIPAIRLPNEYEPANASSGRS